jgi:hypothetical protein
MLGGQSGASTRSNHGDKTRRARELLSPPQCSRLFVVSIQSSNFPWPCDVLAFLWDISLLSAIIAWDSSLFVCTVQYW